MNKAIIYVNQFFGQIGGEDKADFKPIIEDKLIGPAILLNELLDGKVTHTIICGDNFISSNREEAISTILSQLEKIDFNVFIAGPAFQAGRYGTACGEICKAVKDKFNVPVITSMHVENPGVEMFRKDMYIFKGGHSAAKMRSDIKAMANFTNKLLNNKPLSCADDEGYYGRGIRHQVWREDKLMASKRAVDMMIKKLKGKEFKTEFEIPKMDRVPIADFIKDLSKANIAIINTGGIVPVNNPDKIQSASATRWGRYSIEGIKRLEAGVFKTIHAGFDPAAANSDPNVIVPIDALRFYEKEGKIKKLHKYFYSTVGTGTTQAEASRMAKEIIPYLKEDNVDGVIMVST